MIKRAFDVLTATVALVLLSPVMVVIAIIIRRESEGPALFRQRRVGKDGRLFTLLKFRSMTADPASAGPQITASRDSRVTRFGARLRRSKTDELPQLINVVRGEMSIVGPRPEVPQYVAMWDEADRQVILTVRPGITDPATLQLRREEELLADQPDPEAFYRTQLLPEKCRLYREYVQTQSLRTDIGLIFRTFHSVLFD